MEQISQPDYQPRVITCVYCGQAYPQDTPTWGDAILTEHIKVCEKHPMRKAEEKIRDLRELICGMLGAFTKEDLQKKKIEFEVFLEDILKNEKHLSDTEILNSAGYHLSAVNAILEMMDKNE